jgi:hypothetical protein
MSQLISESENYKGPYYIASTDLDTMKCARLQDGRFHVFKSGIASNLITGHEFILAFGPLATIISKTCQSLVEVQPAVVIRISTGEKWPDYYELKPLQEIRPYELPDASCYQVWHLDHSELFVSPELKNEITRSGIANLSFSPGWSGFAAE